MFRGGRCGILCQLCRLILSSFLRSPHHIRSGQCTFHRRKVLTFHMLPFQLFQSRQGQCQVLITIRQHSIQIHIIDLNRVWTTSEEGTSWVDEGTGQGIPCERLEVTGHIPL